MHKLKRYVVRLHPHHYAKTETVLSVFFCLLIFTAGASAADVVRFTNRSVFLSIPEPNATSDYKVSLKYTTETLVGSIRMLICYDPIPDEPCSVPAGFDASNVTLTSQTGETGFYISKRTRNEIILSRATPTVVESQQSTYVLSGIKNPSVMSRSFALRLSDHASVNGSGPVIDLGSVLSSVNHGIVIETQVPPLLTFCLAQQVSQDCTEMVGGNYSDMGDFGSNNTLMAQSQMAVGTNATGGFVITANGMSLAAGTHVIDAPRTPALSTPGRNQFGLNLVANTVPELGSNPDGDSLNASAADGYNIPNRYMYRDGDVVASAPNVSLMRRFTVSYIVNASPDIPAGIYTTTLTYICSGRF